jgi:two-component system OmpR family response regulator
MTDNITNFIPKKKILFVDDEEDTLMVVKTILEKEGYEVACVDSGTKAISEVEANDYSLVILDIMMPDMSGLEVFERISKIKPGLKIIFLSALEASDEKLKSLKSSGATDYIQKPFDRDDLVARAIIAMNI